VQFTGGDAFNRFRRQTQQGEFTSRRIEDRLSRSEMFEQTGRHARPHAGLAER